MLKILGAIVAAAALAGVLVLPGMSRDVSASTQIHKVNQDTKADRLEIRLVSAATCSERAWPYYDKTCVRDTNEPRKVRVIAPELRSVVR